MSTVSANSDVWVIHEGQALLYRQQGQVWLPESRMPFADFHGSAVALASFTLADTCVYLNVNKGEQSADFPNQLRWVGIERDPLRLTEFPHTGEQIKLLHSLKSMGKQACVTAISDPAQFLRAPKLFLASQQETEHLKTWIKSQKNGTSKRRATAQFICSLWVKPGRQHQNLRAVALVCTAFVIAITQWAHTRQVKQHEIHWQKSIQETLERQDPSNNAVSFEQWITQVRKFGQKNRANLSALNIHWSNSGNIHTFAQLDRDRKRVPKGCKLVNSTRAECISQRVEK